MKKLQNAILVGYGSIGKYHAKILQGRYKNLAIIEINETTRAQAALDFPSFVILEALEDLKTHGWDWLHSLAVSASWGPSHVDFFYKLARLQVTHILCEKPLSHSFKIGHEMIATAVKKKINLGVHHLRRYSGFVSSLQKMTDRFKMGRPTAIVMHGGACGLVTAGIQHIDLVCEIFGSNPTRVISTAVGHSINPRSPDLMYYGGTAVWSFEGGREGTFVFSNSSSVAATINIYYPEGVVQMLRNLDVQITRRNSKEIQKFPAITRTGPANDLLFSGQLPHVLTPAESTSKQLDEIESGHLSVFPPSSALTSLSAVIGALASGEEEKAILLPLDPDSGPGKKEWPIS